VPQPFLRLKVGSAGYEAIKGRSVLYRKGAETIYDLNNKATKALEEKQRWMMPIGAEDLPFVG